MAPASYLLCFLTALSCAVLLGRAYRRTRGRLLFWSACCFWGLSATNALVFVDLVIVPHRNLYGARLATAVVSIALLLYGMIWEAE
jgi:hypothetical protein